MIAYDPLFSVQLAHLDFRDKRLNRRCRASMVLIDQRDSSQSFPNIFKDRYRLKGFYRLMNNSKVSPEAFLEGSRRGLMAWLSADELNKPGRFYHFHDSTFGKYHERKKLRLGYIERPTDNGFLLHSGLLTNARFEPLGLISQHYITRGRSLARKPNARPVHLPKKRAINGRRPSMRRQAFRLRRISS